MATRPTLVLTDDERTTLERMRERDARPYLREKAAALLKIADGQAAHQVALTGLHKPRHPDTVYGWLHDWQQERTIKVRPATRRQFSPPRPLTAGNP